MADTKDFAVELSEGKDWREPGVCRCCLSQGIFQSMDMPYLWQGSQENYTDMLQNTFQITLVPLEKEGVASSRVICEACVLRLRDADAFRRQVQDTEHTLLNQVIQVQTEPKKDSALEEKLRVENFVDVKMEHQEDSDLEEKQMAVNFVSVKMEHDEDSDLEEKQTKRNFVNVQMEHIEDYLEEKQSKNFEDDFSSPESDNEALSSVRMKAMQAIKEEIQESSTIRIKNTEDLATPFPLLGTLRKMYDSEETQKRRAAVAAYMRQYRARNKNRPKARRKKSTEPFEKIQQRRENAAERQRRHRARKRAAIRANKTNQTPPNGTRFPTETNEAFSSYATEMANNGQYTDTTVESGSATKSVESLERIQRRREVAAERQRRHRARKREAIYTTATVPADWPTLHDNDQYIHLT